MFYERLTSLCAERGVKITHVVAELRMGSGNLSNWKGGRMPRGESLSKLADYFHVSTDYLLGRTDDPRPINEMGGPVPVIENGPPGYNTLPPTQKAAVDQMVAAFKASEPPTTPIKLHMAAQGHDELETEMDLDPSFKLPPSVQAVPDEYKGKTGGKPSAPEET